MADLSYDTDLRAWVQNGKPLSHEELLVIREEGLTRYANEIMALTDKFVRGELSQAAYYDQMVAILQDAHRMQYAIGRGGQSAMSASDYEAMNLAINNQMKFFDEYMTVIREEGITGYDVGTKMISRAMPYLGATTLSYELGKASSWGIGELPSYPTLPYKSYKWCYMNCGCHWEFSFDSEDDTEVIATWVRTKTDSCDACKARERDFKKVKFTLTENEEDEEA